MIKGREKVFYLISAAVMMLVLFAPGWAWDKFLFGLDTFTMHLPFLMFAKRTWAVFHELPLWMPDIFMGMPAMDSSNLMFFYPTNLMSVLFPLPAEQFYLFDHVIHIAAAGTGMFLLLKRHGMEKNAAYFGAFVFMFSGPLITHAYSGHWPDIKAMALAPYAFYFINRAMNEKRFLFWLSAGLFMALQVLGLGMQVAVYTYAGAAIYVFYLLYTLKADRKTMIRSALFFAAATLSIALFSAPQFFPAQDYLKFSWRNNPNYEGFVYNSFDPAESLVFLLPQFFGLKDGTYWGFFGGSAVSFYVGLIPLLLAAFAFAGKNKGAAIFFSVLGIFYALLGFGGKTSLYSLLFQVPVFNRLRDPSRAMCMLPLCLSFLGAAGLDFIISGRVAEIKKIFLRVAGAAAALAAVFLVLAASGKSAVHAVYAAVRAKTYGPMPAWADSVLPGFIAEDALAFVAVCGIFCAMIFLKGKNRIKSGFVLAAALCLVQFFDVYRIERKFISYRTVESIAPKDAVASFMKADKTIFRAADLNFAWEYNRSIVHNIEFFNGFHAIYTDKMHRLLSAGIFDFPEAMRLFNVKYYIDRNDNPAYAARGLKKVMDGPIKLFEDPNVMPRVFQTDDVKKFASRGEMLEYMKSTEFTRRKALVTDDMILAEQPDKLACSTGITEYTPNRIKISAFANKETMLVLSNMYYPRWKALVDGAPAKIYNVDFALSGVKLAAGSHKVNFYYDGSFIFACVLVMLASFLAFIAVIIAEKAVVD